MSEGNTLHFSPCCQTFRLDKPHSIILAKKNRGRIHTIKKPTTTTTTLYDVDTKVNIWRKKANRNISRIVCHMLSCFLKTPLKSDTLIHVPKFMSRESTHSLLFWNGCCRSELLMLLSPTLNSYLFTVTTTHNGALVCAVRLPQKGPHQYCIICINQLKLYTLSTIHFTELHSGCTFCICIN